MLTRAQQILLKRAQQEARIDDADYRAAIAMVSGIADARSSTDQRLTDAHMDSLLAYFEAIHWSGVDGGVIVPKEKPDRVFRARGFWASRNRRGNTSRDRFNELNLGEQIASAEFDLQAMGYDESYTSAIREKIVPFAPWKYLGALQRTLKSKQAA